MLPEQWAEIHLYFHNTFEHMAAPKINRAMCNNSHYSLNMPIITTKADKSWVHYPIPDLHVTGGRNDSYVKRLPYDK